MNEHVPVYCKVRRPIVHVEVEVDMMLSRILGAECMDEWNRDGIGNKQGGVGYLSKVLLPKPSSAEMKRARMGVEQNQGCLGYEGRGFDDD